MAWWTLGQVVDWARQVDPIARVEDIRIALERRCGSGRIRARGRRRHYSSDTVLPLDIHNPTFIWFSDEHGRLETGIDEISTGEWRDLAFFARPTAEVGEQYHRGFARAFERIDAPVELRSKSKHRLAWSDVEFCGDDVIQEWAHAGDDANTAKPPLSVGVPVVTARFLIAICADGMSSGSRRWPCRIRHLQAKRTGPRRSNNFPIGSRALGCA